MNTQKIWFKRKLYGWGWTPASWEGWVVTAAFIVASFLFALRIEEDSTIQDVATIFFLPEVIMVAVFLVIAYKKGERPRWQWGKDQNEAGK